MKDLNKFQIDNDGNYDESFIDIPQAERQL